MIETLDYSKAPKNFVHCLNADCKQADCCLRYQVARYIPATQHNFRILNPARTQDAQAGCLDFISDAPVKYAYGWTHMFDKLVHETAMAVKNDLLYHYGKTEFYRLKRKEKSFTPQAQQYVRNVFLRHGVKEEPRYDQYQYDYKWKKD